eukprot:Selendium_serpulae@DN2880_c0_g1_i3.p1
MVKKKARRRRKDSSGDSDDDSGNEKPLKRVARPSHDALRDTLVDDRSTTRRHHDKKDVNLVLAEDNADETRPVSWSSMYVGPSAYPRRPLCVVCAKPAMYKCPLCLKLKPSAGLSGGAVGGFAGARRNLSRYVCSTECKTIHSETDCGKQMKPIMGD